MPKNNQQPPEIIADAGKRFKLTAFRIQSKYEDGTLGDCALIKDETAGELSTDLGKNLFMTVYVPMAMPKGNK